MLGLPEFIKKALAHFDTVEKTMAKLTGAEATIADLKSQLTAKDASIADLAASASAKDSEIATLKADVESKAKDIATLQEQQTTVKEQAAKEAIKMLNAAGVTPIPTEGAREQASDDAGKLREQLSKEPDPVKRAVISRKLNEMRNRE